MTLVVYYQMWRATGNVPAFCAFHLGVKHEWNTLDLARAFALKNGYRGLRIDHGTPSDQQARRDEANRAVARVERDGIWEDGWQGSPVG